MTFSAGFLLNCVEGVPVRLRRTNAARAAHTELRVCTSVTLSYRLRLYKESVPKVPRILTYGTDILLCETYGEKERGIQIDDGKT